MEKKRPHYDLGTIKATFTTVRALRITKTALTCAEALGLSLQNVVDIIQGMTREHFYKSMTSIADHTIWQDVYYVPHGDLRLYVKFTMDPDGFLVISFKEAGP